MYARDDVHGGGRDKRASVQTNKTVNQLEDNTGKAWFEVSQQNNTQGCNAAPILTFTCSAGERLKLPESAALRSVLRFAGLLLGGLNEQASSASE